ncbi:hypothetical protein [Companilactobacillus ginsenosidimutans]|uniref:Uncharacterized protein n=1 Tax=Companilactobacillus ginsenosidimutans TaxID=1007676 RepID=A0A0H4QFA1_9LACO|nr:hypothetical protein [Companilactobacillus ginsenosidimutans]AKP66627.1 hypothetical protein ABM34_03025 [Companilactobacillus ginsenosidimutans]
MITTGKTAVLDTSVFFERFLTYRVVFNEYFKTMELIERGETLKHETYSRLADNFLLNVKKYNLFCQSFIKKYKLTNTKIEEKLDNYFSELISSLKCIDENTNQLNKSQMRLAQQRIQSTENEFVNSMKLKFN